MNIEITNNMIEVTSYNNETLLKIKINQQGSADIISKHGVIKQRFIDDLARMLVNGMIV